MRPSTDPDAALLRWFFAAARRAGMPGARVPAVLERLRASGDWRGLLRALRRGERG